MIGLIDYGMGNLGSVGNACRFLRLPVKVITQPEQMADCVALMLPGVGAFDPAMERLRAAGLEPALRRSCASGRPLLGICLGLQLLFEASEEGQAEGLGLLAGRVTTLPRVLPILNAMGVDLVWFGIVVVIMVEVSLITPPVGMNLFVLQSLRLRMDGHDNARPITDIYWGALPFVLAMFAVLAAVIIMPGTAMFLVESMR